MEQKYDGIDPDILLEIALQNNDLLKSIIDAVPYGITLRDSDNNYLLCNKECTNLLGSATKTENLITTGTISSPEFQPNGRLSSELAKEYINETLENGSKKFNWLHITPQGEECPTEIILKKLSPQKKGGKPLIASFIKDLRPFFEDDKKSVDIEDYFLNKVSYKKLFKAMVKISERLMFMYDMRSSQIQFYGNGAEQLEITETVQKFPDDLLKKNKVHPDDTEYFMDAIITAHKGIEEPFTIRFYNSNGTYRYFHFTYKVIKNNNGEPIYTIGYIEDINDKKLLEDNVKRDLLTTCYNKVATETAITNAIENNKDKKCTFFMIDIDNFKEVNDSLGHYFGDLTLSDVGKRLKDCFRSDDIVGRIGGDEFVVFAKNLTSKQAILEKAESIANIFRNSYSGEKKTYKVSASIGITQFPKDGKDFLTLYKNADKALYNSKHMGKDIYTLYAKNMRDNVVKERTEVENQNNLKIDNVDTELGSTIFTLLFEATDIQSAINASLSLIGKEFNTDRCYIFQTFNNGTSYKNTFEWCSEGTKPEIQYLQNISATLFENLFQDALKTGFTYNNFSEVKSAGLRQIMTDKKAKAYFLSFVKFTKDTNLIFGIDDCKNERTWSEKTLNTLKYISMCLSTFLKFINSEK